jgi:isochorismate hydrolase
MVRWLLAAMTTSDIMVVDKQGYSAFHVSVLVDGMRTVISQGHCRAPKLVSREVL